jgi:hypothetical protein
MTATLPRQLLSPSVVPRTAKGSRGSKAAGSGSRQGPQIKGFQIFQTEDDVSSRDNLFSLTNEIRGIQVVHYEVHKSSLRV